MKNTVKVIWLMSIMGLNLFSIGCASVDQNMIVGTWVVDDYSQKHFDPLQEDAEATIIFDSIGKFTTYEFPIESRSSVGTSRIEIRLVTGTGTWKLVPKENYIQLNFNEGKSKDNDEVFNSFGTQLYISNTWSGITLYSYKGDPDNKEWFIFEKNNICIGLF